MSPVRRARGRPNDYDWELSSGSDLNRAIGTIVQFEAFVSDTAETLVRLRGDIVMALSNSGTPTAADTALVAWGVVRSASGSSDVGISPITEGGANYLAYGVATLFNISGTPSGEQSDFMRWSVDSKAMRKLRENESIYVIFETADIVGAPVIDAAFALRGLTAR